jgi:hypothetical protein
MEQIPILKIGDCLLVSIQVDMHTGWPWRCRTI